MVFVRPVIDRMPNRKGKRADEQHGDQGFDERMFGVEIHSRKNRERTSKSQWFIYFHPPEVVLGAIPLR